MARCFISFLGVNDYVRCNYLLNEARVDGVRFVQSALLKLVAADFTAEDSVLIGCTAKARATNLESLIDELADAGWAGPKPAVVDLPEATSERELWEIFQILMDRVRIGDEPISPKRSMASSAGPRVIRSASAKRRSTPCERDPANERRESALERALHAAPL